MGEYWASGESADSWGIWMWGKEGEEWSISWKVSHKGARKI